VIAFVRHGQTAMNRDGRLQGRIDSPLSELGASQAAALARAFARPAPTRVVASPLRRARDTAEAIAAAHALDVEVDDRLIELDYGEWDGRALRDIPSEAWAKWRADVGFTPPGGESLVDVTARMAAFIDDLGGDDLVVAVSHVSPIKAAVCVALGVDERASWKMFLDLASVTRVGRRPDGDSFLVAYNETGHLAEA
jgi:broad specificity phosphatase PhoE